MRLSDEACFPGRAPIDAYGNGGFRFAQMSHRGSIQCLPSGIYAWTPTSPEDITAPALALALGEAERFDFLIVGTGLAQVILPLEIRSQFAERSIELETKDTGAAARTYNVLLAEERLVAAALIAVN